MDHLRVHGKDMFVCPDCIDDYAIGEFIQENAVKTECSYCGKKSSEPIAAPIQDVADFILEGITTEWDDPNNCVGWEDGWVGANVIDSYDLIHDHVELEYSNAEVLDDLVELVSDQQWCYRDPYGMREEEALMYSWTNFCEQVKHHSRYIFFRVDSENDEERTWLSDMIPVSKMLDRISDELTRLEEHTNIVRLVPINTNLWRVRVHPNTENPNNAKAMGTIPSDKATRSNRMSPAGIPMFYGALDSETALKETVTEHLKPGEVVSIATFVSLKDIKVLNLCELPSIPSLFDPNRNYMRSALMFMQNFIDDLTKPISRDGIEHIDYVPTQVFTEYIRYLHKDVEGDQILGIVYPSSRNSEGENIVLFIENDNCCDDYQPPLTGEEEQPVKYLLLKSINRRGI